MTTTENTNHSIEQEAIRSNIDSFYNELIKDPNGRYKSWEHCHIFFKENRNSKEENSLDMMSLHLAFYLASWGMLRGSSFLLQKDYLVHKPAIEIMLKEEYKSLWKYEIESLYENIDLIIKCGKKIVESYRKQNCKEPSSVLLTKILLGVYGCTPAYDRLFTNGLREYKLLANYGNNSLKGVFDFYTQYRETFEICRKEIKNHGIDYPPMKLVDMFFWEEGRKKTEKLKKKSLKQHTNTII